MLPKWLSRCDCAAVCFLRRSIRQGQGFISNERGWHQVWDPASLPSMSTGSSFLEVKLPERQAGQTSSIITADL